MERLRAWVTRLVPRLATPSPSARLDGALAALAAASRTPPPPRPAAAHDPGMLAALALPVRELSESRTGAELGALAHACFAGEGAPRDVHLASRLWVCAASKGDLPSVLNVGLASIDGLGAIPRNGALAEELLSRLSNGAPGHPWAHFGLATLLLRRLLAGHDSSSSSSSSAGGGASFDVARLPPPTRLHADAARALASYRAAVASGAVPPAALCLSNCLLHGVGTPDGQPDVAGSALHLAAAAAAGDPLAAAEHATRLASGTGGVARDAPAAARAWRVAAEGGHPIAMHNVGAAYLEGRSGSSDSSESPPPPDLAAALPWFIRAAAAGFIPSMVNAGMLLERGDARSGRKPDLPAAAAQYAAAAAALRGAIARTRETGGNGESLARTAAAVQRREDSITAKRAVLEGAASTVPLPLEDEPLSAAEGEDLCLVFDSVEQRDAAFKRLSAHADVTPHSVLDLIRSYDPPSGGGGGGGGVRVLLRQAGAAVGGK